MCTGAEQALPMLLPKCGQSTRHEKDPPSEQIADEAYEFMGTRFPFYLLLRIHLMLKTYVCNRRSRKKRDFP